MVLRQKGTLEEGGEKEVVVEGGEEAYVVGRSGEADLTVTDREVRIIDRRGANSADSWW